MAHRDTSSVGAPCWVETFQLDPRAATEFYGPLFGWTFDETETGFTALLDGRRVAGIGRAPAASQVGWLTYVRVADVAEILARAENAGGTGLLGPTPAGPDTDIALLTDAGGVPFGLLAGSGVEVVDEPNTWAMSSLHTTDVDRADAFYGNVFGWELATVPGAGFAEWRLGDRRVAVVTATDGVAVPPHWSINFTVRDADAFAERAVALGAALLMPPTDTPGFRSAVVRDPQGGVVAVSARTDTITP